jgi:hypothetical protein
VDILKRVGVANVNLPVTVPPVKVAALNVTHVTVPPVDIASVKFPPVNVTLVVFLL